MLFLVLEFAPFSVYLVKNLWCISSVVSCDNLNTKGIVSCSFCHWSSGQPITAVYLNSLIRHEELWVSLNFPLLIRSLQECLGRRCCATGIVNMLVCLQASPSVIYPSTNSVWGSVMLPKLSLRPWIRFIEVAGLIWQSLDRQVGRRCWSPFVLAPDS